MNQPAQSRKRHQYTENAWLEARPDDQDSDQKVKASEGHQGDLERLSMHHQGSLGQGTRADKTDDLRTIVQLREDREALQKRVEELETGVAWLRVRTGA
jgi:hypothetical protein